MSAPARQLERVADDLVEHRFDDSGHLVPIDDPAHVAAVIACTAGDGPSVQDPP
ncbi:hypothetical protein [Gordonia polyisoprenivorans]|uniref:hypothetical protein n=1 Tax=Gordonia polyisoprenivorans TaxID=84595 RepID=UPI001AD7722F|nr:hypothetical protein [Gordonia polyisoprenivorans]QTI69958.1 hypothetical protein J6U32_05025 [Gordonia polyisoprenivorans]